MNRKQKFIATRSQSKALCEAEKYGINRGIAIKVHGGYIVYQAYDDAPPKKNPGKRHVKSNSAARAERNTIYKKYKYCVEYKLPNEQTWREHGLFANRAVAENIAELLAAQYPKYHIRVTEK